MKNIPEIENLVKLISKLPGLGPKSARRIILKLISNRNELIKPMLSSLTDLFKNVTRCKLCGTLKSNLSGCNNCENLTKKFTKICVVEDIADQWSIESSSIYQGYFHILGGTISNSNSQNKEELFRKLKRKLTQEILVIQKIQYLNEKPTPETRLIKQFHLEKLFEMQISGTTYLRISRVLL